MPAVDNILIGHDVDQAKAFAKETYHAKKPIEKEAEGSNEDEDENEEPTTLVDKIRLKVYEFIRKSAIYFVSCKADSLFSPADLCGFDVAQAIKQMPEVAAGLAAAAFTLIGMLLALFGLIGSAPTKVSRLFNVQIGILILCFIRSSKLLRL